MRSEIAKYLVSGSLAFICDISALYFCAEFLGFHYLIANFFGYFTGLIVAYLLNVSWVFPYRKYEKTWFEFLIFNIIVLTGLAISEGIMAFMVDIVGSHYLNAKIFASALVMIFNYTAKKFFLFHPPPEQRHL
jgi:putative flippase GtrA